MKTSDIDVPLQPTKCRAINASAAFLAGLSVLAATTQLLPAQTSPVFTRITTGPLVTDLGNAFTGNIGDYDGDGYPDVLVGRYLSGRTSLYHNNGDGTFTSVTNDVFPVSQEYIGGMWGDLDNDGRLDAFVVDPLGAVPSFFAFNNGDGSFTKAGFEPLVPNGINIVDYDQDGLLDLYITKNDTTTANNRLYQNLGGRRFRAVLSAEVGDLLRPTYGASSWADYDDDGRVDAYAATFTNYYQCQMHHNEGGGRFVSVTNRVTLDRINGVAAGWGDYDNDGRVDLFVAGSVGGGPSSFLYRNLGGGSFERASIGVTLPQAGGVAWGDYDNDGFLDLLLTWTATRGCFLFRNNGNGTFTRITSGPIVTTVPSVGNSLSANWFDYDNNGFLDLFVANVDEFMMVPLTNYLFRNEGSTNAWLKVKLVGTVSNRDGVGAKVRAKATIAGATRWQRRDLAAGDPLGASNDPIAHFGLRDARIVEMLRVEWPSGQVTELTNVAVRQILTITEAPGLRETGLAQGAMQMQLTAHPGMSVGMDVSSNLVDWASWQTVPQTNRTTPVTDPEASQHPRRFYKARVQ